jgi:hypothetical protein
VRRHRLGLRMADPPRSRSPPVRVSYGNPRQVIRQRGPTIRRRLLRVLVALVLGACRWRLRPRLEPCRQDVRRNELREKEMTVPCADSC